MVALSENNGEYQSCGGFNVRRDLPVCAMESVHIDYVFSDTGKDR